jgi:hypothetical protein
LTEGWPTVRLLLKGSNCVLPTTHLAGRDTTPAEESTPQPQCVSELVAKDVPVSRSDVIHLRFTAEQRLR